MKVARRVARIGVIALIVLAPVVTGAVGYYLGQQGPQTSAPTAYPVWTDQEFKYSGTGTLIGTLRCTYHRADGSTKITETVMTLSPAAASGRNLCPPPP